MTGPIGYCIASHGDRLAVVEPGRTSTFAGIDQDATRLAGALPIAHGDRVGILCAAGHDFVVAVLACWHAGAIAVPLHPPHPDAELAYVLTDSGAVAVIASGAHREAAERIAGDAVVVDASTRGTVHRFSPGAGRPAMMVYTSGTTGRPKTAASTVPKRSSNTALIRSSLVGNRR